jgi:hypothetical protein
VTAVVPDTVNVVAKLPAIVSVEAALFATPVPPLAGATIPVTLAAVPVVLWFNVGKSAATAIDGTPVVVVFFKIPVAKPAKEVPLILTTVSAVDPVASPV